MNNELAIKENNALQFPSDPKKAMDFAIMLSKSDLVPTDFKNKPGNILIAAQMGAELGLPPLRSLHNISVINGRAGIWGDTLLALIMIRPEFSGIEEMFDEKTFTATCTLKRIIKGKENTRTVSFSKQDAEKANLWSKKGPWTNYPKRMCQVRARNFAIRDLFPDAMIGLTTREELMDYVIEDITADTKIVSKQALSERIGISEKTDKKDTQEPLINDNVDILEAMFKASNKLELRQKWLDAKGVDNFTKFDEASLNSCIERLQAILTKENDDIKKSVNEFDKEYDDAGK